MHTRLPVLTPDKGLDVQVYRYVLGRDYGHQDTAREFLCAGVDHVALSLEDPLGEDQH